MAKPEDCVHKEYMDMRMDGIEKRMTSLEEKIEKNFNLLFDKINALSTSVTELKTERDIKNRNTPYVITAITVGVNIVLYFITRFFKI